MLLFADTEFADFESLDPLSVALVSEDGSHEFYAEIFDCETPPSDFVRQIVLPLMQGGEHRLLYSEASERLARWIAALPHHPTIIVDYPGDWIILNEMLTSAGMQSKPAALMLFPAFELAGRERLGAERAAIELAAEKMPALMEEHFLLDPRRHHALVDARATAHGWRRALQGLISD